MHTKPLRSAGGNYSDWTLRRWTDPVLPNGRNTGADWAEDWKDKIRIASRPSALMRSKPPTEN